jgi:hypothetical protein
MSIFVICIEPDPILETWPPIYRGQEGMVEGRLKASQVEHPSLLSIYTYFDLLYLRVHPTPYLPDPKSFI